MADELGRIERENYLERLASIQNQSRVIGGQKYQTNPEYKTKQQVDTVVDTLQDIQMRRGKNSTSISLKLNYPSSLSHDTIQKVIYTRHKIMNFSMIKRPEAVELNPFTMKPGLAREKKFRKYAGVDEPDEPMGEEPESVSARDVPGAKLADVVDSSQPEYQTFFDKAYNAIDAEIYGGMETLYNAYASVGAVGEVVAKTGEDASEYVAKSIPESFPDALKSPPNKVETPQVTIPPEYAEKLKYFISEGLASVPVSKSEGQHVINFNKDQKKYITDLVDTGLTVAQVMGIIGLKLGENALTIVKSSLGLDYEPEKKPEEDPGKDVTFGGTTTVNFVS